jgi:hypothetical protein
LGESRVDEPEVEERVGHTGAEGQSGGALEEVAPAEQIAGGHNRKWLAVDLRGERAAIYF